MCRKDGVVDFTMNQFLDKLNIPTNGESSTGDRLAIFQRENARVAYPELPASCWKLLDRLARLVPDFRVDTGSSIASVSSSSIHAPVVSSLQTYGLYAVLDGMAQCAIEQRLDGETFESESSNILNCNQDGYQGVLERFVGHVESHYQKNRTYGNTDTISSRTPVADHMACAAVHAFIGHMERSNNYDDDSLFNQLQEQIFHFKPDMN